MKRTVNIKTNRGFSLVELLVVIAVIGLIAAIGIPSFGKIADKAKQASAQTNAKTLCSLHRNAKTAGAGFSATTRGGILDELVDGVTGTIVASDFKMGELSEDDKTEALKYCAYDATEGVLNYYPEGDAPEDDGGGCDTWGPWTFNISGTIPTENEVQSWLDSYADSSKDYRISGPGVFGEYWADVRSCAD